MVDIGIVGDGFMASVHARRYQELSDASVTCVAAKTDPTPFIDEHDLDATAYDDANELYDSEDVDAVDLCTPTYTHADLAVEAAEHAFDILCEKPLSRSLSEAQRIKSAVEANGVTCMPGHVLRFFPDYAAINERVVSGDIGNPGTARARRLSPFPDWGDWYGDDELSGGVLLDLAIHDLDFLRWTFGSVERVFARCNSWKTGQHGQVILRFANGAVGQVEASWGLPASAELESDIELAGTDGLLEYDGDDSSLTVQTETDAFPASTRVHRDGYYRELQAFVEAIARDNSPPVSLADGIASLRLALAAKQSVSQGKPVAPAEVTP